MHAASPLTSSPNAHDDELGCHRLAAGGGFERPHHTQTPTHCLNLHEHTHTQTHFHTDIDTRTETHTLPQLTRLNTSHCTDNSHSDFLRDEKCFRATRRLVLVFPFFRTSRWYRKLSMSPSSLKKLAVLCHQLAPRMFQPQLDRPLLHRMA